MEKLCLNKNCKLFMEDGLLEHADRIFRIKIASCSRGILIIFILNYDVLQLFDIGQVNYRSRETRFLNRMTGKLTFKNNSCWDNLGGSWRLKNSFGNLWLDQCQKRCLLTVNIIIRGGKHMFQYIMIDQLKRRMCWRESNIRTMPKKSSSYSIARLG